MMEVQANNMSENLEIRLSENLTKAMTDLVQKMFDSQKD
jgi:hypothetical protein